MAGHDVAHKNLIIYHNGTIWTGDVEVGVECEPSFSHLPVEYGIHDACSLQLIGNHQPRVVNS